MTSDRLSNLTMGGKPCSFCMELQEGLDGIQLHCLEKHGLSLKRIRREFQCSFYNSRGGAEFMSEHINENHPDQMAANPICDNVRLVLKELTEKHWKIEQKKLKKCSIGFTVNFRERQFLDPDWLALSSSSSD